MEFDITYFISWFIDLFITLFVFVCDTLDSIHFFGTSLLKFICVLVVLSVLLPVILTLGKSSSVVASRSERIRSKYSKKESSESHD